MSSFNFLKIIFIVIMRKVQYGRNEIRNNSLIGCEQSVIVYATNPQ